VFGIARVSIGRGSRWRVPNRLPVAEHVNHTGESDYWVYIAVGVAVVSSFVLAVEEAIVRKRTSTFLIDRGRTTSI